MGSDEMVTSHPPEEQSRECIVASSWAADEVENLERGGRLERVKPNFSPEKL
jgi:hypothetical protein